MCQPHPAFTWDPGIQSPVLLHTQQDFMNRAISQGPKNVSKWPLQSGKCCHLVKTLCSYHIYVIPKTFPLNHSTKKQHPLSSFLILFPSFFQPPSCSLSPWVYPLWAVHLNRIILYVAFCLRLPALDCFQSSSALQYILIYSFWWRTLIPLHESIMFYPFVGRALG